MFEAYKITDADTFDIHRYPAVEREIAMMSKQLKTVKSDHKQEIVISFFKDHCVKTSWLESNVEVVRLVRSGSVDMGQTEKLFSACRHNRMFLSGFEQYISSALT